MQTTGTPNELIIQCLKPLLYKDFVSILYRGYKVLKHLSGFHPGDKSAWLSTARTFVGLEIIHKIRQEIL